ncbi:MAG: 1-acyl-sn-glycerol-3-phosphate acyltransferase [Pseudomonadota bacterium]|nr:1-acyl-sn-glycerol-3-phosphate acyltransferase [Pseudomonadota bacterium]
MFHGLGRLLLRLVNGLELALFSLVMYVGAYLPPPLRRWYPRLFRIWCRSFVRALGVELHLHQKNRRPLPRQYILIANHPSAFEDVGVPALFPVFSLAKVELRDWYIFGRISRGAGTLYLKREDQASRRDAARQIADELRAGRNVCVYPEGGCKGRRVNTFFPGVFDIALQTGVPILPLFLHYEAQEDFEWQGQHLVKKIWQIMTARNHHAHYYVYDAIPPAGFADKEEFCAHVHGLYLHWQSKYLE